MSVAIDDAEAVGSTPEDVWRTLAPRLAARGRMRVSRDGGRNYPRRGERSVTGRLPNQPAAVLIYDDNGCAPVLCLDLDVAKGSLADVDRDFDALGGLLRRCGLRWFSDRSPNGGRHLYVPFAHPVPFHEAVTVTRALTARTPTLDPVPMLGLTDGCIRPPGARHKSGGHQQLDGPLSTAQGVLAAPNSPRGWTALTTNLTVSQKAAPAENSAPRHGNLASGVGRSQHQQLEPLSGHTEPDANYQRIARTGDFDRAKYRTPSEARQAVLWAALASGWALVDVVRRLGDGTWPGLASFYARYPTHQRHHALAQDWARVASFEKRRRQQSGCKSVRRCTTSPHQSRGRGGPAGAPRPTRSVNRTIREWLAAVDLLSRPEDDLTERAVLYALAEAAVLTDCMIVEHGNRSLAIATGLDQSTVGRILHRLSEAPSDRCLIDLVRPARGVRAHTYQLRIPHLLAPACIRKPWRRGRIHALRPAFRELGLPAAFVYAVLEQVDNPTSGREVARAARIGTTAAYEALATLSAWGLATRIAGGWIRGPASPIQLAEQFGVLDSVRDQVERYRVERRAWWRRLGVVRLDTTRTPSHASRSFGPSSSPPNAPDPPQAPGDDCDDSLLRMLNRVLGAIPVASY